MFMSVCGDVMVMSSAFANVFEVVDVVRSC